ncbi:MAG: UDP-N-acetylmuramoyl-tripeptide--D-alanyl-D-alanine ligase [Candidatus Wallbacteria bacterium]|nr:UDP-N-acetylmuramoyl-tripeptide--D-alanyl-D-alanine ligase [Candidatus Wallbacteria bacterium]
MTGPHDSSEMVLFRACQAAEATGGRLLSGDPETPILGFSIDSRTVSAGDCFVALPGQNVDGHDFVAKAAARGARSALVTHALADPPVGLAPILVGDAVKALQALASLHRARFSIPLIAVTGSNGKTSTRAAIAAALGASFPVCATRGNLNNHIGLPLSLFALRPSHRAGVFEVGMNHLGEIAELCRILRPGIGVITNVAPAHLEGVGSLENVARAKGELMEALPPDGELFVNGDCALSLGIAARFAGATRLVSLGSSQAFAHAAGVQVELTRLSGRIAISGLAEQIPFSAALSGRHMAYPLLFAVAVGARLGLDAASLRRGIESFHPEHGRMEVRDSRGVWIIDDCYNANPASMEAALDFLLDLRLSGRRWAVLGDMRELGDRSAEFHREVLHRCRIAAALEGAHFYGNEFLAAAGGAGRDGKISIHSAKDPIVRELRERLEPGDVVLFKGSRGVALETMLEGLFPAE